MSQSKRARIALALAIAVNAALANAAASGTRVDNFMLADQTGMGHELYYYKERPAIVIVSTTPGDAVSDKASAAVAKVRQAFKGHNILFLMLDSSSTKRALVGRPGSADLPVLSDDLQLVGRALGVASTAEAFLIDPKTWTVAYHGPIDDAFAAKRVKHANLTDALTALLAGTSVPAAQAAVNGRVKQGDKHGQPTVKDRHPHRG